MKKIILTVEELSIIGKVRKKVGFGFVDVEDFIEKHEGTKNDPSDTIPLELKENVFIDLITSVKIYKSQLKKKEKIQSAELFLKKLQTVSAESETE